MQLALSVALAMAYVAAAVALGALTPWKHEFGALYWFLVPTVGLTCLGLGIAEIVQRIAPVPWRSRGSLGARPRRVHLSWRTAVRAPAILPVLFFPWYLVSLLWTLSSEVGPRSIVAVIAGLALLGLALSIRKLRRELRLLRDGSVALAYVEHRTNSGDDPWEWIRYWFVTAAAEVVSGRAFDRGYRVTEGSNVPVFYDPRRPHDHIAACACWLEAD